MESALWLPVVESRKRKLENCNADILRIWYTNGTLTVTKHPSTLLSFPAMQQHRWPTHTTGHITVICGIKLLEIPLLIIQRHLAFIFCKIIYADYIYIYWKTH